MGLLLLIDCAKSTQREIARGGYTGVVDRLLHEWDDDCFYKYIWTTSNKDYV